MALSDQLTIFAQFYWTYLINSVASPDLADRTWAQVTEMRRILKKKGVKERQLVNIMTQETVKFTLINLMMSGAKPERVLAGTD